ncbi:nitrilase-related carbon-nitrogen hydrolase [Fischerella thermalis]|jgi:predicted amidohydrolase|uniref:Nitrilase/cyanide hydratase and apolipoprotein N-acyltransferase n=1 Tax=Fischerella thermalis JSC-11 TaxID=741277 RepID=G6FT06_9CYAN|nr:nitrilase-related carbon-nitrogen hydrolase [Fischerella thermalis]PMB06035.1 nitrilase [Fischerella thermalis CCMEE 5328]EHC14992.1 Nitrilase/cyanide hydratase and apolipoprotein N-acyltransferase [Fischerella thermalis JSC-11]PLZ05919.1 nitrilase [Fischerella thermalis WC114]PLZ06112.1 nitrilase [Fischerella thermalis WC119]PLZ13699.1 nitrilase [Fischerella thermalis WC1110]
MTANTTTLNSYRALALQVTCYAVNQARDRQEARCLMQKTIERLGQQIAASIAFIGSDCRLIVLPEYFLTGFPMGETFAVWAEKACLEMRGAEYESLSNIAQKLKIFIAGNAYELDPNFPDLYFQTCFVIDPSGEVVLRYRRLNSMFTPTPHDVWDKYLDCYGLDGVFPVAKTEIGNLAALASEEILYPEVARCLTMRGAEIFLHSTSEVYGKERAPKEAAKICRAVENIAYVVSANTAGIVNTPIPQASTDGGSKIIDYRGLVLAETGAGESMAAFAEINLAALRSDRRRPGLNNLLSRQRFELYADSYRQSNFYPANTMLDKEVDRQHFIQTQQQTIERLAKLGVI